MRSFRRPAVTPPTLADQGPGGRARKRHRDGFTDSGEIPKSFAGHWTKPDVKGALFAMQGPICAYCTADVSENAVDVEHFRPKGNVAEDADHGGYWWLAYEFSNYVLSCTICNQKRKNDSFPLQPGGSYKTFAELDQLAAEPRTLLDPAADPIESWVEVQVDDPLAPLVPAAGAQEPKRIREAVDFFRLNDKVPQVRRRLELLDKAADAIAQGNPEAVAADAVRFNPQSLVCFQLLRANRPDVLPAAKAELDWLLSRLCADLILKLQMMQNKSTPLDESERDELVWALAALWKDPPTGDSGDVESFFARNGLDSIRLLALAKRDEL